MTESIKSFRGEMKKSRFKIWLRAGLFAIFGTLFTFYFFRDIANGYFTWVWMAFIFTLFVPLGFWMSRIVPMQVDEPSRAVTLSFDRTYFILIWVLVIVKLIASRIPSLITASDVIMCVILGIMFGRLGGIGLRVRGLKVQHGFINKE
jgi:predicted neutral ceramidase superfamily lipid hydrolase